MSYTPQTGLKPARGTAAAQIEGGKPLRLFAVGAKGGAAKGTLEWYEAANAADPTKKRGGLTAPAGDWAWVPVALNQQLSQLYVTPDGNIAEYVLVYWPVE